MFQVRRREDQGCLLHPGQGGQVEGKDQEVLGEVRGGIRHGGSAGSLRRQEVREARQGSQRSTLQTPAKSGKDTPEIDATGIRLYV